MDILLTGIGGAAAWLCALLLIRFQRSALLFHSLIAGGLCAAAAWALWASGFSQLILPVSLLLFLLLTLAVDLERGGGHGDAALAFLAAQGAYSIFRFAARAFPAAWPGAGWVPALLLPAAFAAGMLAAGDRLPAPGWREFFSGPSGEAKALDVRAWHVYGVLAVPCALCSACAALMPALPPAAAVLLTAGLSALFWGAVLCLVLMIQYRRESVAALVERQYRDEMRSFMDVIRSQRHDYNFHVQTLARLIQAGNLPACEKYVEELVRDSAAMNALLPIKDPAISALIGNFRTLAAREGVELHLDIQDDLSRVVTNVYETNKVISNLLQNAIDETKSHRDKSYGIHLTTLKRGEFCVIQVANAFPADVASGEYISDIYRQGYTTKAGHDGVGLSSVKTLLERYRGVIYTQIDSGVICFTAKIPLRYAKKPEDTMARTEEE